MEVEYISPWIHQEYTFRHRNAYRTPAESGQEYLTRGKEYMLLLLLLLSCFSRVRLCVTPETAAYQAPPSLGFSRQEHWSGLPFTSPMHESENESEVARSSLTSSDPMDCSLPGSSIHGICQASVLELGAIAFSKRIYRATQNSVG